MSSNTILRLENISFGYCKEENILKNIYFNFNAGEISVIKGNNGAGKSTLLKVLSGLVEFDGELFLKGEKVSDLKEYKKRIAYIPDSPLLYNILTGRENLKLIENLWLVKDHSDYWDRIYKWAEKLHMIDSLDKPVEEYSLGMRNKLFFIGNLARNPEIVFLDEPFSSWDQESVKNVILMLKEYVSISQRAIIMVTHSESLINQLGDKVLLLKNNTLNESKSFFPLKIERSIQ
jgi:ABC-2 type transport system ATP-binding protein